jgi:hypothetical protein
MVIFCRRYLHKLFTQLSKHKGKLKVRHLPIEDVTASLPHHLEVSLVGILLSTNSMENCVMKHLNGSRL